LERFADLIGPQRAMSEKCQQRNMHHSKNRCLFDHLAGATEPVMIDKIRLYRTIGPVADRYLTGITSGCPFSEIRKSIALAGAVVLGFRMVCTLLFGLEPKSPAFIMCAGPPSGS
jgi:hypothetical protein